MIADIESPTLYTVGHSTQKLEDFIRILNHYNIELIVDVRTIPKSRHNPQFNVETLSHTLSQVGIGYKHLTELGELRLAQHESPNMSWCNLYFRGFADYMQTTEFKGALDELICLAYHWTVAIMCAETVPWRCHRSLITDALLVKNLNIQEIIGFDSVRTHRMTPWARIVGEEITYPVPAEELDKRSNLK
jgi:uncharacterized protein (DUF488 family)